MDTERLQALAGIDKKAQHGNMDLFQNSLRIIFGLDPDTIETVISLVRRHGDTIKIRDQQVRRRAGTRAIQMLQQAHDAASSEGDEHYDDIDDDVDPDEVEADPVGDGMEEMPAGEMDGEATDGMAEDEPQEHGGRDVENRS